MRHMQAERKKKEIIKSMKGTGHTECLEYLNATVFTLEQNRVVERVKRSAHSYQHHLQTT